MSLYDSTGLYDQATLTYNGGVGGVAGLPTVGVFIAFDDSPYVAEPSWTEITSYVREIPSIRRARSDDWSTFTGSATLTLDNRDQRFNPYNRSGAYYGKLLPRRQIKIVADAGEITNLITNPSFETNTTNWKGNGGTVTRITTDAYIGTGSYQHTATTTANTANIVFSDGTITIKPNTRYTASIYVKNTAGTNRETVLYINWLNNAGAYLSTAGGSYTQVNLGGGWTRVTATGVSIPQASKFSLELRTQLFTRGAVGNTTVVDAVMFTETNTVVDYFDGSTVGCNWTGTANASTSVKSLLLPIFRGYIAGFPVEWVNNDADSIVNIECFDALSLLADTQLPDDQSYVTIQKLNPIYWFRGDDTVASVSLINIGSRGTTYNAKIDDPPQLAVTKVNSLAKGLQYQASNMFAGVSYTTPKFTPSTITNASLVMWFGITETSDAFSTPLVQFIAPQTKVTAIINTNGFISYSIAIGSTGYQAVSTVGGFLSTEPHHLAITFISGTLKLFIDGRDVSGAVSSSTLIPITGEDIAIANCAFQDCAVFDYHLTEQQIKDIYNAGNATIPETTSARIARLLTGSSFPSSLVSVPASPKGNVSAISTGDAQLVNEFDLVKNSEGGELFVSQTGVITFTERDSQLKGRSAVTQAVFKDVGEGLKYSGNFSLRFDADSMINDIRYDITGDVIVSATNAPSIAAYGQATKTINTQIDSIDDAQPLVNSRLAIFDTPIPQVSPLQVGITRSVADWQNLLSLEVLDQIEVTRTPKMGSVFSDRLLVNEIVHSITPNEWSMQITGSARFSEWFTIDIDDIDGDRLIA